MPSYTGRYSPCRVTSDKECPLKHVFERTQGPKPKVYFPANSVSKQQIKPGNTYLHRNFCMCVCVCVFRFNPGWSRLCFYTPLTLFCKSFLSIILNVHLEGSWSHRSAGRAVAQWTIQEHMYCCTLNCVLCGGRVDTDSANVKC